MAKQKKKSPPPSHPPSGDALAGRVESEGRWRALSIAVLVVSAYAASFSFLPVDLVNRLDGSGLYATSKSLTLTPPMIFGRDILSSLGPLCRLWGPVLPGSRFEVFRGLGLAINVLLVFLTAAAAAFFARAAPGRRYWPLAALLFLFPLIAIGHAQAFVPHRDWPMLFPLLDLHLINVLWSQLGILLAVLSALTLADGESVAGESPELLRGASLMLLALLAALGLFVKFSTGWELLLFFAYAVAWRALTRSAGRWDLAAVGTYALCLPLLWRLSTGGGPSSLGAYLGDGLRFSSSYSEFLISNVGPKEEALYLFPLAIMVVNAVLGWMAAGAGLGGLLLFNSFLQFKHSVVRADSHLFIFFAAQTFTLLCLAATLRPGKPRRAVEILYFSAVLLWFAGFQNLRSWAGLEIFTPQGHVFSGLFEALDHLSSPAHGFAQAEASSAAGFARLRENEPRLFAKLDAACSPSRSVAILPWELSLAEMTTCRWRPLPTLQTYSSAQFTGLEGREKSVFTGDAAPDVVLLNTSATLDGRSEIADLSHVLPEILERYEVSDEEGSYMILRRRNRPLRLSCASFDGGGRAGPLIRARVAGLKRRPWFQLQNALFKAPQIAMKIAAGDGRDSRYRVYATQLEDWTFFPSPGARWEEFFQTTKGSRLAPPPALRFVAEDFSAWSVDPTAVSEVESCGLVSD
ncbi:MAG: hypothetical protein ACHQ49_10150 [Elusimicrobiota bacterium]